MASNLVPLKVGEFGPQGSGKSASAALLAVAISVLFYDKAPVFVVDPEAAWPFLRKIFKTEGVELIERNYKSFTSMSNSIKEAEKAGACVWVDDPLTLHWKELMETYQGKKGFISMDQWGDVKKVWGQYITDFINTPMNCIAAGRLGMEYEEQEEQTRDGGSRTKLVKVGTKFKAGGGESFGYEPHLLLEFSLERKAKKVKGQERPGEGRMLHRVDVLKDRTWALNGQTFRWQDRPGYKKGDYKYVWETIRPHWEEVQAILGQVTVGVDTSAELVDYSGKSDWHEKKQRKEIALENIKGNLSLIWSGATGKDATTKGEVIRLLFGSPSWTAVESLQLDVLERAAKVVAKMKELADKNLPSTKEEALALAKKATEVSADAEEGDEQIF